MQAIDGNAYNHGGLISSYLADALINLPACVALGLLMLQRGRVEREYRRPHDRCPWLECLWKPALIAPVMTPLWDAVLYDLPVPTPGPRLLAANRRDHIEQRLVFIRAPFRITKLGI